MSQICLTVDAWIREAEEASRWVEDLESRVKLKDFAQPHSSRSKFFDLGVKLDRLESLLHNPPAKPILTHQDLEFRWKMLRDIQLRTKALASTLYAAPSSPNTNSPSNIAPVADTKECNISVDCYDQEPTKTSCPQDNSHLLKPLVSDGGSRSESSSVSMFSIGKGCSTIFLFLGLAALLFFIVLLCSTL